MIIYFQSHKVYVNVTVSMPFKQHQVIIVNKILKTKWSIKYGQTRAHKTKGEKTGWLVFRLMCGVICLPDCSEM